MFYGHKAPAEGVDTSCFSQWFYRTFDVDGQAYPTAEHWMMAEKARLFEDAEMLQQILDAPGPKEAKAFGRRIRGFDPGKWDEHKFEIVVSGNFAKFTQHEDLKNYLMATSNYCPAITPADPEAEQTDMVRENPIAYKTTGKSTAVILVEAAGRDVIWGIGLGKNNPKSRNPLTWRGRNLLGFALTAVREILAMGSTTAEEISG